MTDMDVHEELFWHLSDEVVNEFLLQEISHFTDDPDDYLDMAREIMGDLLVKRSESAFAIAKAMKELQVAYSALGLPA